MSLDPLRIIFSGGGTGGHLFPAIALSRAFIREFQGTELLFITTGNPLEDRLICENGFRREMISIKGLKGKNIVDQVKNLLRLPKAVLDSMKILRAFGPQLVMGLGGYSSGPVVLAARLLGLKTAICEQNILPGITNRLLSHLAHRVFVSFPDTIGNFDPAKVRIFGNPVREEIVDAFERQRC
jgi:UDP-N-acetylglucosamine--N-acetylmuramyl-(pentapeptide) pyrophosphoryl-undecaprenol N-acetylglucosamine transferase